MMHVKVFIFLMMATDSTLGMTISSALSKTTVVMLTDDQENGMSNGRRGSFLQRCCSKIFRLQKKVDMHVAIVGYIIFSLHVHSINVNK